MVYFWIETLPCEQCFQSSKCTEKKMKAYCRDTKVLCVTHTGVSIDLK